MWTFPICETLIDSKQKQRMEGEELGEKISLTYRTVHKRKNLFQETSCLMEGTIPRIKVERKTSENLAQNIVVMQGDTAMVSIKSC